MSLAVGGDGDSKWNWEHVKESIGFERLFFKEDADGVDGDRHKGFKHLDEGNREEDIGGIGEPKGEGVESADGKNRGDVEIFGHGNGLDELEDADDYEGQGRTKGHVDHGEGDWEWPIVHLFVEDEFVVDDDCEA